MANYDYDFIGFTYNGKHSIRDLGIYRISSGDRYDEDLTPTLKEKTASVEGQVGQYFFGTTYETKTFSVPFAFEDLSESGLRELRKTFDGKDIHDLIFDENPYKVYSAKVTGTASIKHLCFEIGGQRHYRGDGTVQFTCYYPHAHTPHWSNKAKGTLQTNVVLGTYKKYERLLSNGNRITGYKLEDSPQPKSFECGLVVQGNQSISITRPTQTEYIKKIIIHYITESGENKIKEVTTDNTFVLSSTNEYVYIISIDYYLFGEREQEITEDSFSITLTPALTANGKAYHYAQKNNKYYYETSDSTLSAKVVNHYSAVEFPNKFQWARASGLPLHYLPSVQDKDCGDVPGTFVLTVGANSNELNGKYHLVWDALGFEATTNNSDIIWNSKTGLITNESNELIPYYGDTMGTIPFEKTITLKKWNDTNKEFQTLNSSEYNLSIEYDYWYY